jgi:acyl transferase domain-containing protein/NAD(P)H-dependent flavin oxidoreductase YrpB (nitropropane dioxygenase family)/phosphopantetheinyl transferase
MTRALFPSILLDDGHRGTSTSPEHPDLGRIWNVFDVDDLKGLALEDQAHPPIFRLYSLALLKHIVGSELETCPVILSHLIDLDGEELPEWPAGVAIEVANRAGLIRANALECDLVIGRSLEVPGPSRECSAFLLFQILAKECRHPYFIHGNTGYELFQAYLSLGVSGIVLHEDHFRRDGAGETFRFPLGNGASLRLQVNGGAPEAAKLRERLQGSGGDFLAETFTDGLWSTHADDLLSNDNRPYIDEYLQLLELSPRNFTPDDCFHEHSEAAKQLTTPLPIIQGAMANISITPEFADAVYKAGALPCLALAGLTVEQACRLLRQTSDLNIAFGAGIVSVSESDADLEATIACLEETRPTLVVLAAPQLDHVQRLLQTELNLAVHAPNGAMFRVLYDMGVRTFIVEGEEAGGHVSRIGGLSAWQEVLNEIRKRRAEKEVHLIFAGGIYDEASVRLITHLLNFYELAGKLKVSLQMGTAYLATREALELTPLPATYQQLLFGVDETIVTGETLHRNVRQLATPATHKLLEQEWAIFTSDRDLNDKKEAYERIYQGAHGRAITSQEIDASASYMAGAVTMLLDQPLSLCELHASLISESPSTTSKAPTKPEPIAIVGIGIQIPGADTPEEHFRNLLLKRCFIRDIPDDRLKRSEFLTTDPGDRSRSYCGLAGLVGEQDDDLSTFRIPPRTADEMAGSQVIALRCAHRALEDAGFFRRPTSGSNFAVSIGVNGDMAKHPTQKMIQWYRIRAELLASPEVDEELAKKLETLFEQYDAEHQEEWNYNEDIVTGQLVSLVASRIANTFDLGGLTSAVDAACASGLAAIAQAVTLLSDRRCDAALTGAVGLDLSADAFVSFASLSTLSAQGSFPFDERADGFVIGEGGGLFLLKRQSDALRHGDRIYALIHSWGASSDGAGKGITAPNHKGQMAAVEQAYARCDIDRNELDFLECHATGTPVGDAEERITVHKSFGEPRRHAGKPPLPIGGSKAVTGHLLSGAGVVSTLSALAAINLHRVPPQVNFEQAPSGIDLESLGLKVARRPEVIRSEIVHAGVSSFGFGGVNYHMVLSSPGQNTRAPLLDPVIADLPQFDGLAGDTLFLFPGQGSQHPGMLYDFRGDASVLAWLSRAMDIFKDYSDAPLEELLLVNPSSDEDVLKLYVDLLKATRISQPAIFLTSAVLMQQLQAKGIQPAMAIGHSLGEHSALYAAGMLDFDSAFRIVCLRGQLMSTPGGCDSGAMAALSCGEGLAREILDGLPGYATCANFNSYNQTVVSGQTDTIEQVIEEAESHGVRAFRLPVERAFHSQLVADCEEPMVQALAECDWRNSEIPVLANLSRQVYPYTDTALAGQAMSEQDKTRVHSLLAGLIPLPVDFISQINTAYESGIRRFVEVGPKNILTRLVDQILQGKPFQTEPLWHMSESITARIDGLAIRLEQPLTIKRQPLPAQQKAAKRMVQAATTRASRLEPIDQIRAAVAEVSGYAIEQIKDEAEFERDLGIDTLKIFEILSRLRGSVLPQQVANFRDLTSVAKILAAADAISASRAGEEHEDQLPDTDSVQCYHYRTSITGHLPSLYPVATPQELVILEALPATMAAISGEMLPRLHRLLREHGQQPVESRPTSINVITYAAEDEFYDGAFMGLAAYLRCAQRDIPSTTFSYNHFDGERPAADLIAAALVEPRIGIHIQSDGSTMEGRLHHMGELFGQREQLTNLLTDRDVVLVTGGARGITAEITKSLIERTRARFLILGRQIQTEPWITSLGEARAQYLSANLLDAEAIDALDLGRHGITLLIHGAGIEISKNLCSKSDEEFASVVGIKVGGLERILSQLDPAVLRGVVQFSSVVSYVGNNGQADYAAANGILNGTLPSAIPALSIAWDAWGGVGMATRGMVKEIFDAQGVKVIDPATGIDIFVRLLAGFLMSPPKGITRTAVFGSRSYFQSVDEGLLTSRPYLPLREYRLSDPEGLVKLDVTIDLERHGVLNDHSFGGNVVTPASVILRQFIATALEEAPLSNLAICFSETEFLTPLLLRHGEKKQLQLTRHGDTYIVDQRVNDRLLSVMRTQMQRFDATQENMTEYAHTISTLQSLLALRHTPFDIMDIPLTAETGLDHFGSAFDVLDSIAYNGHVLKGNVNFERAEAYGETLLTDTGRAALLIESAFFTCSRWYFLNVREHLLRIPKSCERSTIFPLHCAEARSATVYTQYHDNDSDGQFDCIIVDERDRPLVILHGFQLGKLKSESIRVRRTHVTSAPVRLGESRLLMLDLARAANWVKAHPCLTADEETEIAALHSRKRQDEKQAGKLAAKLLAQSGVNSSASYDPNDLQRYQVLTDGTPVELTLDGEALGEQPYFSISHSDKLVCVAQADAPVGVDVEQVRPLSDKAVEEICGKALFVRINDFLAGDWPWLDDRVGIVHLLPILIFTQKEAVLKAAGIGLAGGMDEVEIDEIVFNREFLARYRGQTYRVTSTFNDEHVVSVAVAVQPPADRIGFVTRVPPTDLSLLQEHLCGSEQRQTKGGSYSLTHRLQLRGVLDSETLKQAFESLDGEHDVLRMGFDSHCGGFIRPPAGVCITELGLEHLDSEEAERRVQTLQTELAGRCYDLEKDVLYRIMLVHLPGDAHLVAINFHHLIMDCFCSFDYSAALLKAYRTISQGEIPGTSASVAQYSRFATRQRERLTPERLETLKRYWGSQFSGILPVVTPPCDHTKHGVAHTHFRVESNALAMIEAYCRNTGVTLFIGVLSALQMALMQWLQRQDMVVGVPFSLRDRISEAGMLGPFVNLLPIRNAVTRHTSWSELSLALRDALFGAIDHHDMPPAIFDELFAAGNESQPPQANTICQLIYKPEEEEKIPGLEVQRSVIDGHNNQLGLVFSFYRDAIGMTCEVTRNIALVDQASLDGVIGRFHLLVERMCQSPESTALGKDSTEA